MTAAAGSRSFAAWCRDTARAVFGLDLRSLALFRICMGGYLLFDLVFRAVDLRAHYTDAGVMPRNVLPGAIFVSIHRWGDGVLWQGTLLVVAAVFAAALLVGCRTRLATLVSWLMLMSIHERNPFILQGGDLLARLLLLWGVLLPLGARWSLDARRHGEPPPDEQQVISSGTVGYLFQISLVYWCAAATKLHPVWTVDMTAVYYALQIDHFATPAGQWLLGLRWTHVPLTFLTLAWEWLGPLGLFSPIRTGPLRFLTVVLFILFHVVGLGLFLDLGPFPWICSIAWLAALPGWFWEQRWLGGWLLARLPVRTPSLPAIALRPSWWVNALGAFFVGYMFLSNLRVIHAERFGWLLPGPVGWFGRAFALDQGWNMFTPFPLEADGWFAVKGQLRDGSEVDLLRGGSPFTLAKPAWVPQTYPNEHWRKLLMNLSGPRLAVYRAPYLAYLCREWNGCHEAGRHVVAAEMYHVIEKTLPDYRVEPPNPQLICKYYCQDVKP